MVYYKHLPSFFSAFFGLWHAPAAAKMQQKALPVTAIDMQMNVTDCQ
jgi:hypothetical protein